MAAEVSCEAAAESTGPRSQSPAAVLGALTASGMCPGKKVLPGAGLAAKAAARHCVRDVHSAPVTCGLQTHDAARNLVELSHSLGGNVKKQPVKTFDLRWSRRSPGPTENLPEQFCCSIRAPRSSSPTV